MLCLNALDSFRQSQRFRHIAVEVRTFVTVNLDLLSSQQQSQGFMHIVVEVWTLVTVNSDLYVVLGTFSLLLFILFLKFTLIKHQILTFSK
jgi:hypothetical protein